MRIRKRSILPLFSLHPPPQTAPDLPLEENEDRPQKEPRAREKQEEEREQPETEAKERRSGFDPTTLHSKDRSNSWILHDEMKKRCCMLSTPIPKQVEATKGKGEEEEEDDDDEDEKKLGVRDMSSKRNGNMNCGSAETGARLSFSSRVGRWQDGESAFPFKKRKTSYQWVKETTIGNEKKMKTKLKKTYKIPNKLDDGGDHEEEEVKEEGIRDDASVNKKWGSNASVVMEGSRCSRVNGRGWRCCQQTLVGYSLCEHHLGKGRLRSMSSVRSRSSTLKNNSDQDNDNVFLSSSSTMHEDKNLVVDEEQGEEKLTEVVNLVNMKKKKKKKGVVKARSISSLLGETHHATTATLVSNTTNNVMV